VVAKRSPSSRSTYPKLFLSGMRVSYRRRRGLSIVVRDGQSVAAEAGFVYRGKPGPNAGREEYRCTGRGRTGL